MTRFTQREDGKYFIFGKVYKLLLGSRAEVWHGIAYKTSGGLTKQHLIQNKSGRIVSKSKYVSSKKEKRLLKHGYGSKKGKFGFVKIKKGGTRKSRSVKGFIV